MNSSAVYEAAGDTPSGTHRRVGIAAYQSNGQPVNSEDFYALACNPHRSVVVEACAGAGKTWMLVSRILRALLAGAQPQQILAITFTKKAAAEMRSRLQQWLAEFAAKQPEELLPELQKRGMTLEQAREHAGALQGLYLRLLRHGRPVQIRTFHGWFATLVRTAPLEVLQQLGLPADYALLEDNACAKQRVWQPFHAALLRDENLQQDYRALIAEHGRSNAHKALDAALDRRTEFALADAQGIAQASVPHFSQVFPALGDVEEPTQGLFQSQKNRTLLLGAAQALGKSDAKTFAACGVKLEQAVSTNSIKDVVDALFTSTGTPRKFSSKLPNLCAVVAAQEVVEAILQAQSQHAAWQHQQRMVRLTRLLCSVYAEVKRSNGWVDMNDLESAARVLLQDASISGWLQERLDAQVRHLLVDEFQDTNPLQWHALHAWLQSYAGAGQAPSVFIVGDPKQSIYRFRRADPEVFRAAKAFVREGLQGDVLSCDHTRRNALAVIEAVNSVMLLAQEAGHLSDFRAHTTASEDQGYVLTLPAIERPTKADTTSKPAIAWRDSLNTAQTQEEDSLMVRECNQAATWLAACLQAGLPAHEVLVLARKNDRLGAMQQALAQHGVRTQMVEKTLLADAPEVQDIVALVDALISPRHDLSLARALRSPLFALQDEQLTTIALGVQQQARQHDTELASTGTEISWLNWVLLQGAQAVHPWADIASQLQRWQHCLQRLPTHDALSAIYRDANVLARYAAATPNAQRATVLERLQSLLAQTLALDGGRYANAYDWVRAMRSATTAAASSSVAHDAVRLLTVHGAKGLEAALVLLLDTDSQKKNSAGMSIRIHWPGEHAQPLQMVFLASETMPPPSADILLAQEKAADQREEYNAWYVAMTRAKQVLVLSSVHPHRAHEESWWRQTQATKLARPIDLSEKSHVCAFTQKLAQAIAGVSREKPHHALAESTALAARDDSNVSFMDLPDWPLNADHTALEARPLRLTPQAADLDLQQQAAIGQAMHQILEWYKPELSDLQQVALQSLQNRFGLNPTQALLAWQRAYAILQGQGAWAWDDAQLLWQGSEVDVAWQGQLLRIDRLVRKQAAAPSPAAWWVLDFKSALQPLQQEQLLKQLQHYRNAVQALHAQEPVYAAFLTADGGLHVLP